MWEKHSEEEYLQWTGKYGTSEWIIDDGNYLNIFERFSSD